jgi:hypothetical protein
LCISWFDIICLVKMHGDNNVKFERLIFVKQMRFVYCEVGTEFLYACNGLDELHQSQATFWARGRNKEKNLFAGHITNNIYFCTHLMLMKIRLSSKVSRLGQ